MTDHKSQPDPGETPEDVATLYSWANLHGAKYRDFSGSRAVAREEARVRAEAAAAAERKRLEEEAERKRQEEVQLAARLAAEAAEAARQAEAERLAEIARQAEAERQAVLAAQEAQRLAALQRSWQPPQAETYPGEYGPSFEINPNQFSQAELPVFPAPAAVAEGPHFSPEVVRPAAEPARHPSVGPFPANPQQPQGSGLNGPLPGFATGFAPGQTVSPSQVQLHERVLASFPAQITERPREVPASSSFVPGSQWAAPQHPPLSQQRPYAGATPVAPVVDPALQGTYVPNPPRAAGYEAFVDSSFPASEYAESAYGGIAQENQDQPSAFRPAWLAPEPVAAVTPQSPAAPAFQQASQARYPSGYPQANLPPAPNPYSGPAPDSLQESYARPPASGSGQFPGYTASYRANEAPTPVSRASVPMAAVAPPAPISPATPDAANVDPRDRGANRWYALKSFFDPQTAQPEPVPQAPPQRAPVLAVFSLAGGVGKTSLIASLGRALSTYGERVLLIDTSTFGLLPFFFGARDQRPGQLRTFNPPGTSLDAPIQLITLDPEGQAPDAQGQNAPHDPANAPNQDWLAQEVARYTRGVNRVLIDLPTASGSTTRRVLRLSPVVLVPVVPDMNSVVSVGAIEAFFRHNGNVNGKQIMPYYVLNQFDYSLPLHLDVREILREQIGDRLLPFALRRSSAVSEALAEGMTVMDYAPTGVVAEDYASLAGWVRSLSAPATQISRGVRWSER